MAGSLRNFQYVDDGGAIYLFKGDESNTEAVNGTAANIAVGNEQNPGLPKNITPRRVFYTSVDGNRTLSAIASTTAIYLAPPNTIPDPITVGDTLTLSRKNPERVRLYVNVDTGLTDGDTPL